MLVLMRSQQSSTMASKSSERTASNHMTDVSSGHLHEYGQNEPIDIREEYNRTLPPKRQPILEREDIDFLRDEVSRENHTLFNDLIAQMSTVLRQILKRNESLQMQSQK